MAPEPIFRLIKLSDALNTKRRTTVDHAVPGANTAAEGTRLFDVVFASLALLFAGPVILIGALAVKLSSPGPVLYWAKRAGRGGKPFYMFKLRTMYIDTDAPSRRVTEDHDDRITPVGRLLRKVRIDELPQLWNVLRGDMSVVGPRPEDWDIVQRTYTPAQRRVLEVRPGIVSPADVRWYPDMTYHDPPPPGTPLQEHYIKRHLPAKLAEELRYIERRTLLLDIGVVFQTIYCVVVRSWQLPAKHPLQSPD